MTTDSESQIDAIDPDETDEGDSSLAQFVTFFLGKECFAFPMSSVLEIIRSPQTVPVPLTSHGLVGLANLRGEILPVVDLRTTLGLKRRPFDDTTRAVVVDCGRPIALMVDRVSSVLDADPDAIEPADSAPTVTEMALLTGVLKNIDGHELIQIIDVDKVVAHEFEGLTVAERARVDTAAAATNLMTSNDDEDAEDSTAQYVSLLVNQQEYAFEIGQVDEIVRVPDAITAVPHAASHVLGLINLRERLLPLVSLRRMFNLPDEQLTEHHRIVVVRIPGDLEERVGVVVDNVREVLRVVENDQTDMPGLLRKSGAEEIEKICTLESGQRLVGVLALEKLFDHPAIQEALQISAEQKPDPVEHEDLDEDEMDSEDELDDNQLVIYQLNGEEFGVPINFVQEIIRVPEILTEVPKTAAYVEGMINLRGAVLPVANMRKRFEMDVLDRNDRQRILVLSVGENQTGFVVDSVTEVLRLPTDALEASPELSSEQRRLIGRVAKLEEGKRIVQILDAEELMAGQADLTDAAA